MAVLPPKAQDLPADIRSKIEQFYASITNASFWTDAPSERKKATTALKNYLKRLQYFGVYESDEAQWVDDLEAAKAAHQASLKSAALDESRELAFQSIQSTADLHGRSEALHSIRTDVRNQLMQRAELFFTPSDQANAADDASLAAAWLVVSDVQLEPSPFEPLLQIWEQGFWPIGPLAGKFVLFAPSEDVTNQRKQKAQAATSTAAPAPVPETQPAQQTTPSPTPAPQEPQAPIETAAPSQPNQVIPEAQGSGPVVPGPGPDQPVPSGDGWSIQLDWDDPSGTGPAQAIGPATGAGISINDGTTGNPGQTMELQAMQGPHVTVRTAGLPASAAQEPVQQQPVQQPVQQPAPTYQQPAQQPVQQQPVQAPTYQQPTQQPQMQQPMQHQPQMQQPMQQQPQLQQQPHMQGGYGHPHQASMASQQNMPHAPQMAHIQPQANMAPTPAPAASFDDAFDQDAPMARPPKKSKTGLWVTLLLVLLGGAGGGWYAYTNSAGYLYEQAKQALNQKKFAQAERILQFVVRKDTKHIGAQRGLGIALFEMKIEHKALKAFQTAVLLKPSDGLSQLYLGHLLRRKGSLTEALTALNAASQALPKNASVFLNLGIVQSQLGQHTLAQANFRKATQLEPSSHGAWFELGSTYLREAIKLAAKEPAPDRKGKRKPPAPELVNMAKQAETAFRQALLHDKSNPVYHQYLGNSLQLQGQYDGAQQVYQTGLSQDGNHGGLLNDMGALLLQQYKYEDAVRFLTRAFSALNTLHQSKPSDATKQKLASAAYNLGVALEGNKKQEEKALAAYVKYTQLMPKDPDGYCRAGQVLKKLRKRKMAIAAYVKCYERNPTDKDKVKRLLRRMGHRVN